MSSALEPTMRRTATRLVENGRFWPLSRSYTDIWFAWRPVRIGALSTGPYRWLCWLWRNRCMGVTIYQDLP